MNNSPDARTTEKVHIFKKNIFFSKEVADKFKCTVQPKNNAGARSWCIARTSKPPQEAKVLC